MHPGLLGKYWNRNSSEASTVFETTLSTSRKIAATAFCALPMLMCMVAWELASHLWGKDVLPSLSEILQVFVMSAFKDPIINSQGGGTGGYFPHVLATILRVATGVPGGAFVGVFFALGLVERPSLRQYAEPVLEALRVIPPLILIPFVLLLFGPTETAQFLVCGIYTALSIFIHAINALANVPSEYWIIARMHGASRWQTIRTVALPAILPELVGGMRISLGIALGIVVIGEYLGAPSGIGRVLKFSLSFARIDLILVGIVWTALVGLLFDTIINKMVMSWIRWRP